LEKLLSKSQLGDFLHPEENSRLEERRLNVLFCQFKAQQSFGYEMFVFTLRVVKRT